jgi:transketolase
MVTKAEYSPELIKKLEDMAKQLRIDVVEMIHCRGQGHPGGSLSPAEIMSVLFFHHMRLDPQKPQWENRDRFILSKGHASAILYAALARCGFLPLDELETFGCIGGRLQGHPDRVKTPGVEMTSGCLGHGVNIGAGLCLAAKLKGLDYHTYVLLGDGELQAGILWEGAMLAAKYKLSRLICIVDYNGVQLDGRVEDIMPLEPLKSKWESFGWSVLEINGHSVPEVLAALDKAHANGDKPTVIIAHTVKGKGVSYMEGKAAWHGRAINDEEYQQAMKELKQNG